MINLYDPKNVGEQNKNMMYWHSYDDHATTQLHILWFDPVFELRFRFVKTVYMWDFYANQQNSIIESNHHLMLHWYVSINLHQHLLYFLQDSLELVNLIILNIVFLQPYKINKVCDCNMSTANVLSFYWVQK